ncbi:MAG TPA: DUF3866 family protein [Stackebrandtia sp.]|uniref:DUF3866 family protein n=1 Tax=Stackebrandtia sp. TaxID=2023065 RepID=UPI002D3C05F7|nr:DUF3866 family protein [Stackebrandtia sp.]HZE38272.1 DUF3866 family protein [Stackebrandtia sp.]
MLRWRSGTVTRVVRQWPGACEVDVAVEAREASDPPSVRALAYPRMVGRPEVGDRVLLNCNALSRGLGTGGYAFVVAIPDRLPDDAGDAGHAVKARYTPQQAMGRAVDEVGSAHRAAMVATRDLGGMPVVVADLHSALPAILAGIHERPEARRVAYVMLDGGALPAWFSRSLAGVSGLLAGTVTTGQSFGGDLEATNVHTGLIAARAVLGADIAVVTQGPGNLGNATAWGFSGTACGEVVNATAALGGRAIGALRISRSDPRRRHRGVSHHSLTAYGRVALATADLPVPDGIDADLAERVAEQLRPLRARHRLVGVKVDGLEEALRDLPVRLSTMGRGLDDDPAYFLGCAVAGRHAADLLRR